MIGNKKWNSHDLATASEGSRVGAGMNILLCTDTRANVLLEFFHTKM